MSATVHLFPVRHHSPACALALRSLAAELQPAAILIEGPSDFNEKIEELLLPHRLPIAVYSYVLAADGRRRGAFYPLCEHSPEWQALAAARDLGAVVRFIDLPWAEIVEETCVENEDGDGDETAEDETTGAPAGAYTHRYAEPQLRRSAYVERLCTELGVDGFNALWDELFEIEPAGPQEIRERVGTFCSHSRELSEVEASDRRREAFMCARIREAAAELDGPILVVTGGFHTPALAAWQTAEPPRPRRVAWQERGIALTPYSDKRLDALEGYEAGMPGPGFYSLVWQDRVAGQPFDHRRAVRAVVRSLRGKGQAVSAADLIAVESTARSLARLRGHGEIWRRDIIDALRSALIKDEVARGGSHPLLAAVDEVLRGSARGRLAEGTSLPPLVHDLEQRLETTGLTPEPKPREVELDLFTGGDRERSRLLHCLRLLDIAGFSYLEGTDLKVRDDLARVWERWRVLWSPELTATAVEASRYGAGVPEAAAALLAERAAGIERDVARASEWLVDAALAGVGSAASDLAQRLRRLISASSDFLQVVVALGHLLYLYRYDRVLELEGRDDLGPLLAETFERGLWLLEGMGTAAGKERQVLDGISLLVDTVERCGADLGLGAEGLVGVLSRIEADRGHGAMIRGGAVGALWLLDRADAGRVQSELDRFADADHLGDFLTGLFAMARERVQRQPDLLAALDGFVCSFDDNELLHALPSLRLAFTFFTPREKHHISLAILERCEGEGNSAASRPLPDLVVGPEEAAAALALEADLAATLARYGLRGGGNRYGEGG